MVEAAFVAWLGAALIVLADGRRGLALGLALLTAGLAVLAWPVGMAFTSVAIAAGGLIAAGWCWRSGPPAWGIMPAGSTPRLVLCIGSGLLALWVASSVTTGTGAPLRFAVLVIVGLMGARVLMSREAPVVLAAIASFALALGVAPGLGAAPPGPVPAIVGALIAVGVMFVPSARDHLTPSSAAEKDGA
ncbi:MAG: hypothetical protein ACYDA0_05065 [Candidatus Dormibacteraceae bacterium]